MEEVLAQKDTSMLFPKNGRYVRGYHYILAGPAIFVIWGLVPSSFGTPAFFVGFSVVSVFVLGFPQGPKPRPFFPEPSGPVPSCFGISISLLYR